MGRQKSMIRQVQERLDGMTAFGESKFAAKMDSDTRQPPADKIYSYSTLSNYKASCCQYVKWAKETHGCKTLDDAHQHVGEYLQGRIDAGKSAWTIKRDASALGKLYQQPSTSFGVALPSRHLSERTKHRQEPLAYSEANHATLAALCRSSGLRRHEVAKLTCNDIWTEDGKTKIYVKGKGGRERIVTCLDDTPSKLAANARLDGRERLLPEKIPCRAPIHQYRREYAQTLYRALARTDIPPSDRWVCRGERSGLVFDKRAMQVVSESLGHSRLSVVVNYLT